MEEPQLKAESKLEIPLPPALQRLPASTIPVAGKNEEEDDGGEIQTPFFKSRARLRRKDTWVISIFIAAYLGLFIATMAVNDCWTNSHGVCALKPLRSFSFQPLSENPLLGPSASTLDKMGALRRTVLLEDRQTWRLFSCPWLHAGLIHLCINLSSIIFFGFYLEQEFGPLRTGIIYLLSSLFGTLVTAVFVRDTPVVSASAALFGLLGATLSALVRNWRIYSKKVSAVITLFLVFAFNFLLGMLPYADNYGNLGGFIAGFLLGLVLLFTPQPGQATIKKGGFYEYKAKVSFKLKKNLDRPLLRSAALLIFILLLAGVIVAVLLGVNVEEYCRWCGYVDCIPSDKWSCNDVTTSCKKMVGNTELTLTCTSNGNFKVFPFSNISEAREKDLCTMICS